MNGEIPNDIAGAELDDGRNSRLGSSDIVPAKTILPKLNEGLNTNEKLLKVILGLLEPQEQTAAVFTWRYLQRPDQLPTIEELRAKLEETGEIDEAQEQRLKTLINLLKKS